MQENKQEMTFEQKLKRIEEISQKIEENSNLDESIALYAEGTRLAQECMKELDNAKGKITEIKNGKEEEDEQR